MRQLPFNGAFMVFLNIKACHFMKLLFNKPPLGILHLMLIFLTDHAY